jgi:hypothetical protein
MITKPAFQEIIKEALLTQKMDKKYMKKCSVSLTIKEMQIKVALRFHLIPGRMTITKETSNNKCW